jgi:hypothetical protein
MKLTRIGTKPCPNCGEAIAMFATDDGVYDLTHVCGLVQSVMKELADEYGGTGEVIHIEGEWG